MSRTFITIYCVGIGLIPVGRTGVHAELCRIGLELGRGSLEEMVARMQRLDESFFSYGGIS